MTRPSKLPTCEKCNEDISDDLKCERCRREYTWLWVQMRQRGER